MDAGDANDILTNGVLYTLDITLLTHANTPILGRSLSALKANSHLTSRFLFYSVISRFS